ncbi:uncharacterized protein LOC110110453 isoform X1 [Dendrobium catenatum]|uniref:uncharacterized protein LOC110110453 isoform X1 n=2 Tax=Dendrobium catenatum TaxID=906689 RepID=UPI0009F1ADE0|nr:uncharacterized protein LOC110110453 isoform X1 [Dendrobium catenatum]
MVPKLKGSTNKRSCAWTALVAIIFLCKTFKSVLSISDQTTESKFCQNQSKPLACESLPQGIIISTTNLEMQHLWKFALPQKKKVNNDPPKTLLAMAVGIKQKKIVNKIVKKFLSIDSTVMLFHYDGFVNGWRDLKWIDRVLHISTANQTKWWFAKRFLHPDVVSEYDYIFLWGEDLRVDYFNPKRYLSIVESERLEISQPELDLSKSEMHHRNTVRTRNWNFNRWLEMRAPVFSKSAWRCSWHLIQNDLILALGVDFKLGNCAQGDITKNVGIVDKKYIVHRRIPTSGGFGGSGVNKAPHC